ncbi:hypothetical protein F3Y22_tig00112215pilonHSYRG00197 [Hibiscus syriacus]|uniref:Myb/SANT-like DNA-binding domain-containing protein n=1 Tax=Hibiscus syriacus TaxID=106335 RepID=A0A6A2XJ68_HIBSY|nr:trihelix transcription factor ASIL2-like [Hibiscus syriacus]XP_039038263.1 trihelix transcription factor ASIL2-like [Hibiscus syriacus]KAE8669880.1 hypothetical protein F3Y22_tig00112215pilonHSYRG00197 [Hibiscus syriacus]
MDKETNLENQSLLSNNNISITKEDSSPKKHPANTAGGGGDRLKRDEWSEGAVSSLLEAYENKWVLRNRAKLKGQDWEDVARYVSARANCTKSPKTQTQCKNKIESMKKRYRSESATADGSSWPLYPRLDLLLRGSTAPPPPPPLPPQLQPSAVPQAATPISTNPPRMSLPEPAMMVVLQQQHQPPAPPPPQPPQHLAPQLPGHTQNSHSSNGIDRIPKEDGAGTRISDHLSDKIAMETYSSTPTLYGENERPRTKKLKTTKNKKRRNEDEWEIAKSIEWVAQVVLKSEHARMETMKEIERMRVEAEAKRGETDLKRTEIIATTQLEIARLFAASNKGVDSSLRIGRN